MSVTQGLYRIGTVPYPGEDGSYVDIRYFAGNLGVFTGDITGVITSDTTSTEICYFHNKYLNGHTLCIDNSIDRSIGNNYARAENKLVFDSTVASFHGLYFRQDAYSGGRYIIRNQFFQRVNQTATGQSSDLYFRALYRHWDATVENNTFYSPHTADNTSWYPIWLVGTAAMDDGTDCHIQIRNNVMHGYNIGIIAQNFDTGDMSAIISNNVFYPAGGNYSIDYAQSQTWGYNNVSLGGAGFSVAADTTGYSNISNGANGAWAAGTNYINQDVGKLYDSTVFGDPNYAHPNIQEGGIALHAGTSDGQATHTTYYNGLPIISSDVQIGAFGVRTPPPIMTD